MLRGRACSLRGANRHLDPYAAKTRSRGRVAN